ncbi:MAG: DUF1554 domain-containing protein [Myxococcales bacterium]|nr:DUF1554 domain-containing protein [Myxococcales bacterium]
MGALLTFAACGDSSPGGTPDDGAVADTTTVPDGQPLRPCTTPGQPCAAHTTCAINPICGNDGLCRPSGYQNCDDGLDCTTDTCLGQGKCENTPNDGFCALPIDDGNGKSILKCFTKGDSSPDRNCQICDPDRDKTAWSAANGGPCDDGNSCTKDDYCDNGTCKGTDYRAQCDDNISCTDDVCDGKGGCVGNQLRSDACLIQGTCYKDGEQDATGCNVCDTSKSQSQWTALGSFCLIGAKCYKPGDRSTDGCGECDPTKDDKGWTPLTNVCQVAAQCYKPGDKNTAQGGCGECDPTASATSWTVKGNNCLIADKCQNPNDQSPSQCGVCDPAKDKYAWTPLPNLCDIDGTCYTPNAVNTAEGGCGVCDPALSGTAWSIKGNDCYINKKCYKPGDKDPTGCGECVPGTSKTSWTPIAGCWAIIIAALNEPHSGKLGGTAGADALCAQQASAAGRPGQWKALLADSNRSVQSLITGTNATTRPVITTQGVQMYANWNSIFTTCGASTSTCTWPTTALLYTFAGRVIEENEPQPLCTSSSGPNCFYDADYWHGMNKDGTVSVDTCQNWTSETSTDYGSSGEADFQQWHNNERNTCDQTQAVLCVQVGP